jgi:hypothetical protein
VACEIALMKFKLILVRLIHVVDGLLKKCPSICRRRQDCKYHNLNQRCQRAGAIIVSKKTRIIYRFGQRNNEIFDTVE